MTADHAIPYQVAGRTVWLRKGQVIRVKYGREGSQLALIYDPRPRASGYFKAFKYSRKARRFTATPCAIYPQDILDVAPAAGSSLRRPLIIRGRTSPRGSRNP